MKTQPKVFLFLLAICALAVGLAMFVRDRNIADVRKHDQQVAEQAAKDAQTKPPPAKATSTQDSFEWTDAAEYKSEDGVTTLMRWNNYPYLANPFSFNGTTTAFENQVAWRVTDAAGVIVASGNTYVHSPDSGLPGPFSVTGTYAVQPTVQHGTLEVFEPSPKDGSPTHRVSVIVTFYPIPI